MATNVIPPIDTTGIWELKTPFTTKLNTAYTLIAQRKFEDVTKLGKDVYSAYYLPYNIKEGENIPGTSEVFFFAKEVENNVVILTLRDSVGNILYVPSSFVLSYPDTSIVPYRLMIASIVLGIFRPDVDYSILVANLEDVCKATLGLDNVTVNIHAGPTSGGLSATESDALETARQNKQASEETNLEKVIRLEKELAKEQLQNQQLTEVLINNGLVQT